MSKRSIKIKNFVVKNRISLSIHHTMYVYLVIKYFFTDIIFLIRDIAIYLNLQLSWAMIISYYTY